MAVDSEVTIRKQNKGLEHLHHDVEELNFRVQLKQTLGK